MSKRVQILPNYPIREKFQVGEGKESYNDSSIEDHYRRLYFEVLDLAVTGISQRFNQPGYSIYKNDLASCQLSAQLQIWGAYFAEHCEPVSLRDCIQALQKMSATQKELLSEVCKLARLILVMPATNASSERSFSSMRRLKTYLRNTMCQSRLNHVMLLNIHQEKLDALSMDDIAEEFIQGNDHRLRLLGRI